MDDLSVVKLKEQVDDYINTMQEAIDLSHKCRDYYDGYQWTEEQVAVLKARGFNPVVINRVKSKINGLLGLTSIRHADPKAYPRTKAHENAVDAITDSLRYVADKSGWKNLRQECAKDLFVEGTCALIVDARQSKREVEIDISRIPFDRFYFDPFSRELDFSDARYLGHMVWMDFDDVKRLFPDADLSDVDTVPEGLGINFEDQPEWSLTQARRKRVRVAQHFFKKGGKWMHAIFVEGAFLVEPEDSPYLDEDGDSVCPIVAQSAYIDRFNNRYGEVKAYLDPQDEINHRRSKFLHILSSRQTVSRKGAIADIAAMKRELAKPNGHVEYKGDTGDFDILPSVDMANGQLTLLQEAKSEIDAQSFNAQMAGDRQDGSLSGRAIKRLQQAGVQESQTLFNSLNSFEIRMYEQVWYRVRHFWDAEKWIRITDDQDNLRWVGLNSQVTLNALLEEIMDDEARTLEERLGASAMQVKLEQTNPEQLQQIVETRNNVAEIDADIILDVSFDTVNAQEEQFEMLLNFGAGQNMDIVDLIEISSIRGKDELIERIEKRRSEQAKAQQAAIQAEQEKQAAEFSLEKEKVTVENAETYAKAQLAEERAKQVAIETANLIGVDGDPSPQVNV